MPEGPSSSRSRDPSRAGAGTTYCPRCLANVGLVAGKCVLCSTPLEPQAAPRPGPGAWIAEHPWSLVLPAWLAAIALVATHPALRAASVAPTLRGSARVSPATEAFAFLAVATLATGLVGYLDSPGWNRYRGTWFGSADRGSARVVVHVAAILGSYWVVYLLWAGLKGAA